MRNELRLTSRAGFTLIEVLVTLILVALLAAAVFPVITQQIGAADAPKTSSDLAALRTAVEAFNANVNEFPSDVEDLVHRPSDAGDFAADGTSLYSAGQRGKWNGPYLDVAITEGVSSGFTTGIGSVGGTFTCLPSSAGVTTATCANGASHFVTAQLTGFDSVQFRQVNDLFDTSESGNQTTEQQQGKLRCVVSGAGCTTVLYLIAPYRP